MMDRRNQTSSTQGRTVSAPAVTHSARARTTLATDGGVHHGTRAEFSAWLTAGRTARGMTREQVARVTRIQLRTIERLEEGQFDELPADVFVRGFIRNYARCVGLSIDEALARYGACGFAAAPVASAQAQALLDTMALGASSRAVTSSVTVIRPAPQILKDEPAAVEAVPESSTELPAVEVQAEVQSDGQARTDGRKTRRPTTRVTAGGRRERDAKGRFVRKGTLSQPLEAVSPPDGLSPELLASFDTVQPAPPAAAALAAMLGDDLEVEITVEPTVETSAPEEFAPVEVAAPAPLFSSPAPTRASTATVVRAPAPVAMPSLVIDDDDPEQAEREREQRAKDREEHGGWRSFLPPALLDQDRGRQGGLTLAVIILLIVATLTLSYLMRRPSSTGEGVTAIPAAPSQLA